VVMVSRGDLVSLPTSCVAFMFGVAFRFCGAGVASAGEPGMA
jgi:hypothetical protein